MSGGISAVYLVRKTHVLSAFAKLSAASVSFWVYLRLTNENDRGKNSQSGRRARCSTVTVVRLCHWSN